MSEKRYTEKCEQCEKPYVAKKSNSRFCSSACRARWNREHPSDPTRKKPKFTVLNEVIEAQRRVIQSNAGIAAAVMPDPVKVKKVSCEVGKDLTECKRPDGSHLYTEQDLWILIAKINQLVFAEGTGNLLSELDTNMRAEALIRDFEKRFDCKFDDVKSANQGIRPGTTDAENETLIVKYASLSYSR